MHTKYRAALTTAALPVKRNRKDVFKSCSEGPVTEVSGLRVSDAHLGVESNQYRGERAAARKELGSMRRFTIVATLLVIVGVSGAPSWAVAPAISVDLGEIDRAWAVKASPKTDSIVFLWTPSMSLFSGEQALVGECRLTDEFGEFPTGPAGKHKVKFKSITLLGVDSGNLLFAVNQTDLLTDGQQGDLAVWLLTNAARFVFSNDSSILVSADVKVFRKVNAFHELSCAVGVLETADIAGSPSGIEWQEGDSFLPATTGLELPRLLKTPARP